MPMNGLNQFIYVLNRMAVDMQNSAPATRLWVDIIDKSGVARGGAFVVFYHPLDSVQDEEVYFLTNALRAAVKRTSNEPFDL